jgi:hypothetical protein
LFTGSPRPGRCGFVVTRFWLPVISQYAFNQATFHGRQIYVALARPKHLRLYQRLTPNKHRAIYEKTTFELETVAVNLPSGKGRIGIRIPSCAGQESLQP